jgi:hypothetical protein
MLSDPFRQAAEAKDFSKMEDLFTESVVFRSPVVFKAYEGRDALSVLLSTAAEVCEDFRYTDQVETGNSAVLVFKARVGEREVEGADFLYFDETGQVEEMMVMVRPLSGAMALAEAMKARLEAAGVI